jgi:hypothetical protein
MTHSNYSVIYLIYKKYIFYELWYLTSNETTWLLEYDNVENNNVDFDNVEHDYKQILEGLAIINFVRILLITVFCVSRSKKVINSVFLDFFPSLMAYLFFTLEF